jgi:hypothetical protein
MRFVYIPGSKYYLRFSGLSLHDRQNEDGDRGRSKCKYMRVARQDHVITTCDHRLVGLGVFVSPCSLQ